MVGRRGVSTVIANLMMVTIAIVLGIAVVGWASMSIGSYQGGASLFFQNRGDALREVFAIEDVWFDAGSPKHVDMTVRNVGTVEVRIEAVYFNGTMYAVNTLIPVASASTITVQFNWGGTNYVVVVASSRGNTVTQRVSTSN